MAKASVVLWTHKTNADGHHPVWLRFCDARRTLYASLGVSVHPRFWNGRQRRVRKGHPHADRINELIRKRVEAAEDERLRLLTAGEPVTAERLKAALAPAPAEAGPGCFLRYVEAFLDTLARSGKVAREKRERVVVGKLRAFSAPAGGPLPFGKLTPAFLRDFEAHLVSEHKNTASTVHANMGVVKNHFRRAIREGVVPRESDPFHAYVPPRIERTERPKLSDKELAAIETLDLGRGGPDGPLVARVRDYFLFSLYAAGVRFGDVARFRRSAVVEDGDSVRLAYTAGKTGKRAGVMLPEPAVRILRPYLVGADGKPKGPEDFLFPILDGYDLSTPRKEHAAVSAQNALANKYLKRVAERAGVRCNLSFHVARHSFADLARRRGWNVYDISKALRHSSLAVTERYLAGDDSAALDAKVTALFDKPAEP